MLSQDIQYQRSTAYSKITLNGTKLNSMGGEGARGESINWDSTVIKKKN